MKEKKRKIDICKMQVIHCSKLLLKHEQTSEFQQQHLYSSISENKKQTKITTFSCAQSGEFSKQIYYKKFENK